MSIMDRIFVGEVVQDFGVFEEKPLGLVELREVHCS